MVVGSGFGALPCIRAVLVMIVVPVDEERPVATGNFQPNLEAGSEPNHLAIECAMRSSIVLAQIQYNTFA
jgi:hypothetical protein